MNCFISGGITNVPDYMSKFASAAHELKQLGFMPLDPAAMSKPLVDDGLNLTHAQWLEIDFAAIKQCDAIYHLHNWKKSPGANKEHLFALAHDIPILYQENFYLYKAIKLTPDELIELYKAGGIKNAE